MRLVLEEKLAGRSDGAGSFYRDVFCVLVLAALGASLPCWRGDLALTATWLTDETVSYNLLIALGMLIALRSGAVDVSVWASAGAGGLAAAWMLNGGHGAPAAVAAGLGTGLAIGLINAVVTGVAGIPSVVTTAVVGLGAIWTMQSLCDGRDVSLDTHAIATLNGGGSVLNLQSSRFVVGGMFLCVAGALAWGGGLGVRWLGRGHVRGRVFASLCVSGVLAAGGGVAWLLSAQMTPVPHRLIDDLRVPAAVLLAGGLYLRGSGRSLLSVALLPGALLVTSLWRQHWVVLDAGGYLVHVAVLGVVVELTYTSADRALRGGGRRVLFASLSTWFVLCLMAVSLGGWQGTGPFVVRGLRVIVLAQCAAMVLIWAGGLRATPGLASGCEEV